MFLLIVPLASIALTIRAEECVSANATAATELQNLTDVVGTHGSGRDMLSRADTGIPIVLAVAGYVYLAGGAGKVTQNVVMPPVIGALEAMQVRGGAIAPQDAPGTNVADNALQDVFTVSTSDLSDQGMGLFESLFDEKLDVKDADFVAPRAYVEAAHDIQDLFQKVMSTEDASDDALAELGHILLDVGKKVADDSQPILKAGGRVVDKKVVPQVKKAAKKALKVSVPLLKKAARGIVDASLDKLKPHFEKYVDNHQNVMEAKKERLKDQPIQKFISDQYEENDELIWTNNMDRLKKILYSEENIDDSSAAIEGSNEEPVSEEAPETGELSA